MEAYQLSRRTFAKHLAGEWREEMITGEYPLPLKMAGFRAMYCDFFKRTEEWVKEGYNVLYAEADTGCAQPVEIFGKYDQMMMFWETCATWPEFKVRMNSGVMYFPATMDMKLWDICRERMDRYQDSWHTFEVISNAMFWAQEPTPEFDATLNWSPFVNMPIPREQAKILHFHSSRGIGQTLGELRGLVS